MPSVQEAGVRICIGNSKAILSRSQELYLGKILGTGLESRCMQFQWRYAVEHIPLVSANSFYKQLNKKKHLQPVPFLAKR
jgi:hypothetical protein